MLTDVLATEPLGLLLTAIAHTHAAEGHAVIHKLKVGAQLAFLSWDFPRMPWDGTDLWVATIGDDGYVSIVGRSKDMIICGGLNVYPKEIEEILDAMPGVV